MFARNVTISLRLNKRQILCFQKDPFAVLGKISYLFRGFNGRINSDDSSIYQFGLFSYRYVISSNSDALWGCVF